MSKKGASPKELIITGICLTAAAIWGIIRWETFEKLTPKLAVPFLLIIGIISTMVGIARKFGK